MHRWKPSAALLNCFFAVLLFAQASALPVHMGLLLLPAHTAAMTHGCSKGTCCTPLCYLDKHGVHHCVHMPGDSCDCGMSTNDTGAGPVSVSAIITLPKLENLLPMLASAGVIRQSPGLIAGRNPETPTPPPK